MGKAADEKRKKKPKSLLDEQTDLKSALVAAAHEGDSDDDLFTLKEKTDKELEQEAIDQKGFEVRKSHERSTDGDDIVARYWKADEDLGDSEQFLRDYILNKGWMETASMQGTPSQGILP